MSCPTVLWLHCVQMSLWDIILQSPEEAYLDFPEEHVEYPFMDQVSGPLGPFFGATPPLSGASPLRSPTMATSGPHRLLRACAVNGSRENLSLDADARDTNGTWCLGW